MKRAARVFAAIVALLVAEVGLVFLLSVAEDYASGWFGFAQLVFLGANILIVGLIIYCRHKRRNLWIKEEAERWLADRRAQAITPPKKWGRAFRRGLLWMPSLIALSVFLFLPEAMGIVSHTFDRQSYDLNHHRLHLPLTSFVRSYQNLYVSALIGRGIGRVGPMPYWQKQPPLSSLFFYAVIDPSNDHPQDIYVPRGNVLSKRTLAFGNGILTCWEFAPNSGASESELVTIHCLSSKNDLYASFYGSHPDMAEFYEVIEHATHLQ